jgi:DNA-binding transcriptional LysR family regulator
VRAVVSSNGFGFLRSAALAGGYITILPDMHAAPELRGGRLVRVLPDYTVGDGNVYLVHPAAKVLPAKARVFRDFVQANIDLLTQGAECVEAKAQQARANAARSERRAPRPSRPT